PSHSPRPTLSYKGATPEPPMSCGAPCGYSREGFGPVVPGATPGPPAVLGPVVPGGDPRTPAVLRPLRLRRGGLGHGTAAVPRWLGQGTAAGFLTRMAMLIGGSGMFSAGSQPGLDGTLRMAWVGIAGGAVGNAGGCR